MTAYRRSGTCTPDGILLSDEKMKMPTADTYTDLDIQKDKVYSSVAA